MFNYLENNRKDGMWSARWGINYIYAIGSVYPGLAKIGYDFKDQTFRAITNRLIALQQEDGGYGQDQQGYNIDRYLEGVTTVSMTSWGLLALIQTAHVVDVFY